MRQLIAWSHAFALSLGGTGLLLVSLVDASVLSMPELVDVLVILMTIKTPSLVLYFAAAGTVGSVAGSLGVHYLGRKGGEALLRSRFDGARVDRALAGFRRWGASLILVPAMLPPPTPFKLLCLAAGASGMKASTFAWATGVGRGVRYALEGAAAVYFGAAALTYLEHNAATVGWLLLGLSAVAAGVYWHHHRRRAAI